MAVPGIRNGMEEEDEILPEEEVWGAENEEVPVHLRAMAAAAETGDVDALREALDNLTGNINDPLEDGDTALHFSCLYGHLPCVQLLLERGASLESKDVEGAIPLHDACAGGYIEIVQLLLDTANSPERIKWMLETVDMEGDTPLHHAARGEHLDVVQLLLRAGAHAQRTNIYGKTPAELSDPGTEVWNVLEAASS